MVVGQLCFSDVTKGGSQGVKQRLHGRWWQLRVTGQWALGGFVWVQRGRCLAASRHADKLWGAARLGVRGTEGMEAEEEKLG